MNIKIGLLLATLLMCFKISAQPLSITEWIEVFRIKGVNVFYSSDYLTQNQLTQIIDLDEESIDDFNTSIKSIGLNLVKVDDSIYVIKPTETETKVSTGLIVKVRDANNKKSIKKIKAKTSNGTIKAFNDGFITFYDIDATTQSIIISSSGYYPKKVDLDLNKGSYQSLSVELEDKPISIDKIIVTASRINLASQDSGKNSILREDIENSVSMNNDPLRSVSNLAGNTSTGLSGKYRTRGGHENESLILFDNYILRNPYHYNHFFSLYSTINQSVVDGIDFYSGVFPVEFGGRLSSVLTANSGNNINKPTNEFGVDFINAYYTYRHSNSDYSRQLLASFRTGLSFVEEKIVDEGYLEPKIYDTYLKYSQDINEYWHASQHLLFSKDEIQFDVRPSSDSSDTSNEVIESADSKHQDINLWMQWNYEDEDTNRNILLYYNDSSKSREGTLVNSHSDSSLEEETFGSFFGAKYSQSKNITENFNLSFGVDIFHEQTNIESHRNIRHFGELIEQLELDREYTRDFHFKNQGSAIASFVNTRYKLNSKLVFDLGFHFEQKKWIQDNVKSPRFNLSYFYNDSTTLRFGIGRHQQSQYIDEVYLEDEAIEYHNLTSADIAVIEYNKIFDNDVNLRIEVYKKEYSETQPYFENLFNELHILPDLYFDRVEIQPDDSYATGAEFTLRGRFNDVQWLVNYTFSDVEDETDDEYHSRSWDQHHAVKFGLNMPIKSWFLSLSGNYHSGWPRTSILLTDLGYEVGSRNEDAFKGHLEIDAKISRDFKIYNGIARLTFQVNNLSNSFNTCCIDYSLENGTLNEDKKEWLPFTPITSFSYSWD